MGLTQAAMAPVTAAETVTDDQLAVQARTDAESFAPLYVRHVEPVYRYLRARGATEDDAAELVGLAFERALRHIRRYHPGGSGFRAWVLRIARNALIDSRRRSRETVGIEHGSHLVSPDRTPEEVLLVAEERRRILALVGQLPPVQQDALSLRFAAGLSSREIGAVIGKSEAATKKLLTRSLHTLKEAISHEA
jgi:RNA polymerase sigma-70 factor (ECF subfamily)